MESKGKQIFVYYKVIHGDIYHQAAETLQENLEVKACSPSFYLSFLWNEIELILSPLNPREFAKGVSSVLQKSKLPFEDNFFHNVFAVGIMHLLGCSDLYLALFTLSYVCAPLFSLPLSLEGACLLSTCTDIAGGSAIYVLTQAWVSSALFISVHWSQQELGSSHMVPLGITHDQPRAEIILDQV